MCVFVSILYNLYVVIYYMWTILKWHQENLLTLPDNDDFLPGKLSWILAQNMPLSVITWFKNSIWFQNDIYLLHRDNCILELLEFPGDCRHALQLNAHVRPHSDPFHLAASAVLRSWFSHSTMNTESLWRDIWHATTPKLIINKTDLRTAIFCYGYFHLSWTAKVKYDTLWKCILFWITVYQKE